MPQAALWCQSTSRHVFFSNHCDCCLSFCAQLPLELMGFTLLQHQEKIYTSVEEQEKKPDYSKRSTRRNKQWQQRNGHPHSTTESAGRWWSLAGQLHCIFSCPFLCQFGILGQICFIYTSNVWHQRVIWIWVGEQRTDGQENCWKEKKVTSQQTPTHQCLYTTSCSCRSRSRHLHAQVQKVHSPKLLKRNI